MFRLLSAVLWLCLPVGLFADEPATRRPAAKDLNGYFPFTPPTDRAAWDTRKQAVREQLQVALGLWPTPDKTPLVPTIHGKIERQGYTIEKVFFASTPGHYVTGNLYRPTTPGKRPGVLCPHGHWRNGRFYDAGESAVQTQIKQGAEQTVNGARFPLQARCAQLARMGCTVFHFDMVGYADSTAIAHASGFTDAAAELRLQSALGLQTWNCVRALDFLLSLPDVDATRIGVTGASGGGTQTFLLGALDERPTVAFPAVMVSTAMQGGCVCENCSYLRIDTGNVEFAALFAPRPLAMTGANDWTKAIETKGLPELQKLYTLLGAPERVTAKYFPFEHNYNQVSREMMYHWFNRHLFGKDEPVKEQPFEPVPPTELSVFDAQHSRPADELDATKLRAKLSTAADSQLAALAPAERKRILTTALRVMVGPAPTVTVQPDEQGVLLTHGSGVTTRVRRETGQVADGPIVIWAGAAVPPTLRAGCSLILVPELSAPLTVNAKYAGYTFGYNRPPLAEQVRDLWATLIYAQQQGAGRSVRLAGLDAAGVPALLLRALTDSALERVAADLAGFRFANVVRTDDVRLLPGAVKYGDVPSFVAQGTAPLWALRTTGTEVIGSANVTVAADAVPSAEVVAWLLR